MADHLFIRISSGLSSEISWITTDASGRRTGIERHGSLADAATKASSCKVVLIVPGTEVVNTQARVPLRGGSKLRQAIPYALEDQLAEDVEKLHFAIGKRTADGEYPVAVTARENMESWLGVLEEAGIRAQSVVADTSCVPVTPGGVTIIFENDACLLHGADGTDIVLEGMSIDQVLELSGVHVGDEASSSMPVNLYMSADDHEKHKNRVEFLSGQFPGMNTRIMADGSIAHLASGMFSREAINLRQGDFASRSSPESTWKPWRLAAGLAAAVFLVLIGGEAVELAVLKNREKALDESIATAFTEAFPGVTLRGDPANQMRSELAALRAAAGSGDSFFLEALAALAAATNGQTSGQLDSVGFRNGVLDLKIIVPSVEVLDRIRQSMESAGSFEVQLESANPSGNQVEGRIQLRRSNS
ncbi:MAG: type II secretion system protein GspL [Gammaproteobacteria bacterium]|nr:type II secretion system protein GspL [Gammaproteobacteria bacterium]